MKKLINKFRYIRKTKYKALKTKHKIIKFLWFVIKLVTLIAFMGTIGVIILGIVTGVAIFGYISNGVQVGANEVMGNKRFIKY
jgi:hypothetical protein